MFKGLQRKFPEQKDFIAKYAIAAKIIATYVTLSLITIFIVVQIVGWALSTLVFPPVQEALTPTPKQPSLQQLQKQQSQ
ncbi:MAG: hypothetical protein ABEI13_00125 [Candidatus Paceibacteria bacterium]